MLTRREFSKYLMSGALALWLGLDGLAQKGWARAKRIILPKGTNPERLAHRTPAELDASQLELTPAERFGTMGLTDHGVDIKAWRLQIGGKVDNPIKLSYEQVTALPRVERRELLICPGVFSYHANYTGASLKDLLARAGLQADARQVTIIGPQGGDSKTEHFKLAEIQEERVFLAWAVNGEVLPQKHGYPLRVVAPDRYGDDWVKYVEEIRVV